MVRINDTSAFYAGEDDPSLFWELTVCQSLAHLHSGYQAALPLPRRYGEILGEFLVREIGLAPDWVVVEVGGGYGHLMQSLLQRMPLRDVTLVDVSPFFTARQRQALAQYEKIQFVTADAVDYLETAGKHIDLLISNENMGDFPTVTGILRAEWEQVFTSSQSEGPLAEVAAVVRKYELPVTHVPEVFHFNLGAIRYLEALAPRARTVFLSEHGCDTRLPPRYSFLPLPEGDGYPREIHLKGHCEYSIRFDYLARVAKVLGYRVRRWHMAEMLGLRDDSGMQAMARVRSTCTETAEMVHEFCEHLAEYQVMVLEKET